MADDLDQFSDWHPALRPMRRTCERMLEHNHPKAFALLAALAICNSREAFVKDRKRVGRARR